MMEACLQHLSSAMEARSHRADGAPQRVNGRLAVGRLGTRSDADLAWETWERVVDLVATGGYARLIAAKLPQPRNAPEPMPTTFLGIVTAARLLQPKNA